MARILSGFILNPLRLGGTYLVHKKPIFLSTSGLHGLTHKEWLSPRSPGGSFMVLKNAICSSISAVEGLLHKE